MSLNLLPEIEKIRKSIEKLQLKDRHWTNPIQHPKSVQSPPDIAPYIEHTLLKSQATRNDIIELCNEAKQYGFLGVCVHPVFVEIAKQQLSGTPQKVITVAGFPLGANQTGIKAKEAKLAIKSGADEIDMVIAIGALKAKEYKTVYEDIYTVTAISSPNPVKVILETALLSQEEKIAGCLIAVKAGAAFVKTSTGFAERGATIEDVTLIRTVVGETMGVKASGSIKNFHTALAMLQAGADRLGCSSSVIIVSS